MKLIVGLGNPGEEYKKTRHNSGFMFIDNYANRRQLIFKEKMNALYAEDIVNDEKIIIIKPLTFMNMSGNAVKNYVDFYKINISDILVIYDDMSFEVGKIKIKSSGSSGGHNGINNIINMLHTKNISRVKIGISKNDMNMKDYVLSKFSNNELELLNKVLDKSEEIINDFVSLPIEHVMSKYNK